MELTRTHRYTVATRHTHNSHYFEYEFKCKMYLHTSFSWKTFGTDLHTEQEAQTSD